MKAIVVYESYWGNTAAVARAIAEGIGPEPGPCRPRSHRRCPGGRRPDRRRVAHRRFCPAH